MQKNTEIYKGKRKNSDAKIEDVKKNKTSDKSEEIPSRSSNNNDGEQIFKIIVF